MNITYFVGTANEVETLSAKATRKTAVAFDIIFV